MIRHALVSLLAAVPALAQTHDHAQHPPAADPHAGHAMPAAEVPPPTGAGEGPAHAADTIFAADVMAAARRGLHAETTAPAVTKIMIDRAEAQLGSGDDSYVLDLQGWHGDSLDKLWLKAEVEGKWEGPVEAAELQALWSHAIGPFFDLQAGVRYDIRPRPDRPSLVLGVQGLAPYMWEIDAAAFVSSKGDVTARIEAEYDQRITQRLMLQPRIEAEFSAQDIPEYGIGSGLVSVEAGVRLGYQFSPQFKPYVGAEWQKAIGDTADFARADGEDSDRWQLLVGFSAWF